MGRQVTSIVLLLILAAIAYTSLPRFYAFLFLAGAVAVAFQYMGKKGSGNSAPHSAPHDNTAPRYPSESSEPSDEPGWMKQGYNSESDYWNAYDEKMERQEEEWDNSLTKKFLDFLFH